jgi:hypothetical protein
MAITAKVDRLITSLQRSWGPHGITRFGRGERGAVCREGYSIAPRTSRGQSLGVTSEPFTIPALLLFFVAVPLVLGVIPRNRFYGVRTARTLSDDGVWYPANRLAGAAIMAASGVYGALAAIVPYDRLAPDSFWTWCIHLVGFVAPVVLGLAAALWSTKRL